MKWRFWQRDEVKASSVYDALNALLAGYRSTKSGVSVNWSTALQVSAVFACIRVIADGVAQVPWKVFQQQGRSRAPAPEHSLYRVLHRRPNPWQTSFEFRHVLAMHAALTGNAYAFINRFRDQVAELILLEPQRTTVKRDAQGRKRFEYRTPEGKLQPLTERDVWHITGPSWDSHTGLEAVRLAREAIGLAMATEETQALFHANGVQTSGAYSLEGALGATQYAELREHLKESTAAGKGLPLILDRGAKWLQTQMSGVDAQHLETRRNQVEEICRHFRVMPIMVGFSDKATTYASAEQMFLAHVVHTLAPWYERLEQSADVYLLSEADGKAGYYCKFVEEGLLRGALKDTAEVLDKYVNGGLMTPNEAREKLDLNPMAGAVNDQLRVPQNIVGKPAASDSTPPPSDDPPKDDAS